VASTDQKRKWYPDVVLNHADRGTPGFEPVCDTSRAVRIKFPKDGGGYWLLLVHPDTVEAWKAYVKVLEFHGESIPGNGGTHNCRNIGTSVWPSLHAYCVACDLPPNTRKSAECQADILAVRTMSGAKAFKNLASIDDRMHDEIDCSPADLASGVDWTTVRGNVMAQLDADDLAQIEGIVRKVVGPTGVITDPNGNPRPFHQYTVNGVWHAVANGARMMDHLVAAAQPADVDVDAVAGAVVAALGPALQTMVAAELKKLVLKAG
jgi:hypothetical protein